MKRLIRKVGIWYANCKIRKKIAIAYITLSMMTLLFFAAFLVSVISKTYTEQVMYSAKQSFLQAEEFLQYRLNSALYASDLLRVNDDVQRILAKREEEIKSDIIQQNKDMHTLENFMYSLCNSMEIYQISLYVNDYLMYANQEVLFRNLQNYEKTREYQLLNQEDDPIVWLPPQEIYSLDTTKWVKAISCLRKIRNTSQLTEFLGIERVSIEYSDISSIIEKSNITHSGLVLIQNSNGELIACSNENMYNQLESDLLEKVTRQEDDVTWKEIRLNQNKYTVNAKKVDKTDWTLIAIIPRNELYKTRNDILVTMLMMVVLAGLVISVVTYFVSNSITRRISQLATYMKETKSELPKLEEKEYGNDEVGVLYDSFVQMSDQITKLIEQQYENGKAVKHAELKALQAQINPHFLYNTLDLINWEAMDHGSDHIVLISQALAKFYKLSLNHGKDIATIQEEILHIQYYTQIQNYRFDNRIQLVIQIPEEYLPLPIVHLILQPLVENSVLHGLAGKGKEDILIIQIKAKKENRDMFLTIEDNGMSMTSEQMESILTEPTNGNIRGYGVHNIQTRIQLTYGTEYGLHYENNELGGVTVTIHFPV